MPLNKSALAKSIEGVLTQKASLPESAMAWANAYASYAQAAMSSLSSLPTNATANAGILNGAFMGAFNSLTAPGAASIISSGVMAFWTATLWVGAAASGITIVPGNFTLAGSLTALFLDTSKKSESEKASQLADAFDVGAKQVMVMDTPYAPPNIPVSAPIA